MTRLTFLPVVSRRSASSLTALGLATLLGACVEPGPAPGEEQEAPALSQHAQQLQVPLEELALPLSVPSGRQYDVATARAGDTLLVVWAETDPDGFADVRGVRLRVSDGAMLDASPLCIACSAGVQQSPAVASNGSDFLVTWNHMPLSRYGYPDSPRILGVRVRAADGAVLGAPAALSPSSPPQFSSTVASDGSNYLVVWQGVQFQCDYSRPRYPSCGYRPGIYGTRVSGSSGAPGSSFLVSTNTWQAYGSPQVAFGGGQYLVTWSGESASDSGLYNVYATRLRADGWVLDRVARQLAPGVGSPAVASSGSGFLVAWLATNGELRATGVGPDGAVSSPGGLRVGAGRSEASAQVLYDGEQYRVAWEQGGDLERQLVGARVQPTGAVESGSESVLAYLTYPYPWMRAERPALAAGEPGRFLVGYVRYDPAQGGGSRARLRWVLELDDACDVARYLERLEEQALEQPSGRSLQAKAEGACRDWRQGKAEATRGKLQALLHEVQAQRGKQLDDATADILIAALSEILGH